MLNYRSTTGTISFININQKKKEKKRKLSTAATNGKSDQQATTYLNGYISNHQLTLMHYPSDPSHPFMRTPDSLFGTATMTNMLLCLSGSSTTHCCRLIVSSYCMNQNINRIIMQNKFSSMHNLKIWIMLISDLRMLVMKLKDKDMYYVNYRRA